MDNVIRPRKWRGAKPPDESPSDVGYGPIVTLLRGAGIDAEVIPDNALCAHCAEAGAERCYYPSCALYVDGA